MKKEIPNVIEVYETIWQGTANSNKKTFLDKDTVGQVNDKVKLAIPTRGTPFQSGSGPIKDSEIQLPGHLPSRGAVVGSISIASRTTSSFSTQSGLTVQSQLNLGIADLTKQMPTNQVILVLEESYQEHTKKLEELTKKTKTVLRLEAQRLLSDRSTFADKLNDVLHSLTKQITKAYHQASQLLHPNKYGGYEQEVLIKATALFQAMQEIKLNKEAALQTEYRRVLQEADSGKIQIDVFSLDIYEIIRALEADFKELFLRLDKLEKAQKEISIQHQEIRQIQSEIEMQHEEIRTGMNEVKHVVDEMKKQREKKEEQKKNFKEGQHAIWLDLKKNNFPESKLDAALEEFKEDIFFCRKLRDAKKGLFTVRSTIQLSSTLETESTDDEPLGSVQHCDI